MSKNSIWPYGTLSVTNILGQSEPGSNDNEEVLHIPHTPGLEPYYLIVSCHIPDTRWKGSYHSAEIQSTYYIIPTYWASIR